MINQSNTIILVPPAGQYPKKLYLSISQKGYKVFYSMRGKKNIVYRFIRSFSMKYKLVLRKICYGSWKKENLCKHDNILIFHDKYSYLIIDYIRNGLSFKGNIILFYLDPITDHRLFESCKIDIGEEIRKNSINIYSFEKKDCVKFGIKYNSLFFFKEDLHAFSEVTSDIFFIGTDKNRLKEILEIQSVLEKGDLKCEIHICKYNGVASTYGKAINYKYQKFISYEELLKKIGSTRCVLDISPDQQNDITLRVLEALFYRKKVITNNKFISNYSFYNSANIFIWGQDSQEKIKDFIYSQFEEDSSEEIEDYDFDKWIGRF